MDPLHEDDPRGELKCLSTCCTQSRIVEIVALFATFILFAIFSNADTTDTCIFLNNVDLTALLNADLGISIPDIFGTVSGCLCVSGIDDFIDTNIESELAVSLASMTSVVDALTTIVSEGGQSCVYPSNTVSTCSQQNTCGFSCLDGFSLCNGQCSTSSSCPSQAPSKRDLLGQVRMGTRLCPLGTEACNGFSGPRSYECIDVRTSLDSCGGCVFPLPGKQFTGRSGTDCTTIPGVGSVQCRDSKCVVHTCLSGWDVSKDGDSCIIALD